MRRRAAVPFSYIARNLWVRRVTTLLTAGGMALVVYVFATVLMMSEGIRSTLVATGQPDNVMVLRKGAACIPVIRSVAPENGDEHILGRERLRPIQRLICENRQVRDSEGSIICASRF